MTNIFASNDITDYRGYLITDFGTYVEVIDNQDDSLFGIYETVQEAERDIDSIFEMDEDAEVIAIEHEIRYNRSMLPKFAEMRGIEIDHRGNVLSDYMDNPNPGGRPIRITYSNLSSMVKSFNKYNNTTLRVTETADGFKVMSY